MTLLSLMGATACGGSSGESLGGAAGTADVLGTSEAELTGTEVTLPVCDAAQRPSNWLCWLDGDKQTACSSGQTPWSHWLHPYSAATYVRADPLRGAREVKAASLYWGTFDNALHRVEKVKCDLANSTYEAASWSRYTGSPVLQAKLTSYVDHIRPAVVRGTAFVSLDEYYCAAAGGCSTATTLRLVIKQRGGAFPDWTQVASRDLPIVQHAPVGAFEVETLVEPGMQVVFELYVVNSYNSISELIFHDLRLFTETCIPDLSNPGQCLP
ncbi:hypothetical protein OWM54_15620 [Myxococcus sp. MISCRS1]|jgi:hypothetical protein|uniref:hypothetical protein n=1 Tax=Myxococcus sp. MISCRS1 TaxID=2996786 RepID=UPI002270D3D2|nr:hypothetical protein [Myxococcus sp. MISCRS1]MCY0998566.1 hypothetical protein [Myxococcus sp. MISCRS1]